MDAAAFGTLVQRLERSAARRPAAYRVRVAGLALLGYAYILGALVALVGATVLLVVGLVRLSVNLFALKLILPLLVVIAAVLKALWVKFSPPEGLALKHDTAPALFALARDCARRLHAPRVHAIVAVPDLNAAVMQVPRLGMLGWYRNYLIVGLALLHAVPPEEWRAILAHEMGHLSGKHGRFGSWIYRLRSTWSRLVEELEQGDSGVGKLLFHRFVNWYAPYFNAYSFVLARAHEYEADRASADVVGGETARCALLRTEVASRQMASFWNRVFETAARSPDPPPDAPRHLRAALRSPPYGADATAWVAEAWRRPTDYSDTHPSLADRLLALGWPGDGAEGPSPPGPFEGPSAAEVYLGGAEAEIADYYDRRWVSEVGGVWKSRHAEVAAMRRRLEELDAAAPAGLPSEDEWERMRLCEELGDPDRAMELAERLLEREPTHTGVRFRVAARRLQRGDQTAVADMEALMRDDPRTVVDGCEALFAFHSARGDTESAERCRARAVERYQQQQLAEAERAALDSSVEFAPHGLPATVIAAVRDQLNAYGLEEAYLARRLVKHLPEVPCYILAIRPLRSIWRSRPTEEEIALRNSIARDLTVDFEFYVILVVHDLAWAREKMQAIRGVRLQ